MRVAWIARVLVDPSHEHRGCSYATRSRGGASMIASPLLTDLYQLSMVQAYLESGRTGTAVFEFFVRKLPPTRRFLVAAGLEQAVDWLTAFAFSDDELAWLRASGLMSPSTIDHLATLRFRGDVDAIPEGRVVYVDEPILRVTAPLPVAQLVETRLINILHFQTLIATKAAHLRLLAPGKTLIDFGLRRAHGGEAGLVAARAAWMAGFDGTATLLANRIWGIPVQGTMAHSFVQSFDAEWEAFEAFARARPRELVLLIDTYDCGDAAAKVGRLAPLLAREGIIVRGVRIDSGDLVAEARRVRAVLDGAGLQAVRILASGGIDEDELARIEASGAPVDGYGIGTHLTTSADAPALDCAYKLQEYDGIARRKLSPGKQTWPGRKQVWRRTDADGRIARDVLSVADDFQDGETLLVPVLRGGRRVDGDAVDLAAARRRCREDLARLPVAASFRPEIAPALQVLATDVDRRLARQRAARR
jgi:nicotinate phosphoribosyltransferase